jgi:hypothetical protein
LSENPSKVERTIHKKEMNMISNMNNKKNSILLFCSTSNLKFNPIWNVINAIPKSAKNRTEDGSTILNTGPTNNPAII